MPSRVNWVFFLITEILKMGYDDNDGGSRWFNWHLASPVAVSIFTVTSSYSSSIVSPASALKPRNYITIVLTR